MSYNEFCLVAQILVFQLCNLSLFLKLLKIILFFIQKVHPSKSLIYFINTMTYSKPVTV